MFSKHCEQTLEGQDEICAGVNKMQLDAKKQKHDQNRFSKTIQGQMR